MGIEQDLDRLREKVIDELKRIGPRECARLLDKDAGYISRITSGKQTLGTRTMLRIAKTLKIHL
jgi:plasmid maintenance system antidote protein VapI